MPRTIQAIQADANRVGMQLANLRRDYVLRERDLVAKFDALSAEVEEAQKLEAAKTPDALRRELDEVKAKLEALTAPANDKETA